jgi:hypothetical protein
MPEGVVYVGRGSKWGNPFKVGAHIRALNGLPLVIETPSMAVRLFTGNAMEPHAGYVFRQNVRAELRGKDLACWCPLDQPCHADVLLEIAIP